MSSFKVLLAALTVGFMPSLSLAADPAPVFNDAQKAAIEATVRDLLTKKEPEIVMQAAQTLQEKAEKEQAAKGKEAVSQNLDRIFKDANSPVGGNPKGDVTVVEFFDYSCGYCKMAQEVLKKYMAEEKNVRFVYKELPILGDASIYASKAALASVSQGKYVAFHEAMMEAKERLTEDSIKKIAKDVGLDVAKLTKDMESDKIKAMISANQDLAADIGARGTPAFVIGEKLYPGALSPEQLKEAVDEVRKAKKK